jgi:hypothetical protein
MAHGECCKLAGGERGDRAGGGSDGYYEDKHAKDPKETSVSANMDCPAGEERAAFFKNRADA